MRSVHDFWGGAVAGITFDPVMRELRILALPNAAVEDVRYVLRFGSVTDMHYFNKLDEAWEYAELTDIWIEDGDHGKRATIVMWDESLCELAVTYERLTIEVDRG